tara:strand:- start:908 stop:1360 length:453 start_codon:yes stop_codon:yes gene_type:complete
MRVFPTGVTIVATINNGVRRGLTVNSFVSLSLDPLRVLVSISKSSHCYPLIQESGVYSVNLLSEKQRDISSRFADPKDDKFHCFFETEYISGVTGCPLIQGCIGHIESRIVDEVDVGDHTLFIGSVVAAHIQSKDKPLVYFDGDYAAIDI